MQREREWYSFTFERNGNVQLERKSFNSRQLNISEKIAHNELIVIRS
jgi:hypothetical protein